MCSDTMSDARVSSLETQLTMLESLSVDIPSLINQIIPETRLSEQHLKHHSEFLVRFKSVLVKSGYNGEINIYSELFRTKYKEYLSNLAEKQEII